MKKTVVVATTVMVLVITIIIILTLPSKKTVVVAVLGDFTGGETAYDVLGYHGIELAIEEINESKNTSFYKIEPLDYTVYETDEQLRDRLNEIDADVVFGPFLSGELINYSDFLATLDIPVFIVSATHDVVTGIDDNIFRFMNSTSNQATQTAGEFFDLNYEDIYLIYDTYNQTYTKEILDYITSDPLMDSVSFYEHELLDYAYDFRDTITTQYDAIFLCARPDITMYTINTIRGYNIEQPIFMCSYADSAQSLSILAEDIMDVYLFTNRNIEKETSFGYFESNFATQYGVLPNIGAMYGYELMYLYTTIINVNGTTVSDIQTFLDNTPQYNGLFFTYYTLNNGDYYTLMGYYEVVNHDFVKIRQYDIE